jgi:tRNA pseudouridine65 synthase
MKDLRIVYQDSDIVAVEKPAGLMVHRSKETNDRYFLLQLLRDQLGQFVYPVHRLDRATSGIILFAGSSEISSRMAAQFRDGKVKKTYLGIARGHTVDQARIEYPLADPDSSIKRNAITVYHTLARIELDHPVHPYETARYSLVVISPLTGRRHQIRRHFKHIFHPIIGDVRYGDGRHNRFIRKNFDVYRLMLHAYALEFLHPADGKRIRLASKIPDEFSAFFESAEYILKNLNFDLQRQMHIDPQKGTEH